MQKIAIGKLKIWLFQKCDQFSILREPFQNVTISWLIIKSRPMLIDLFSSKEINLLGIGKKGLACFMEKINLLGINDD